jgi:hypothetical protein
MKLAGFFLLLSGWPIVLAAVALLKPSVAQNVFALAGLGVQGLGLAIVVRSHKFRRKDLG